MPGDFPASSIRRRPARSRPWVWLPCLLILLPGLTRAESNGVGGFPQIPASARGLALGGNMAALASGSEAIQWNPAGLLLLDHRELGFAYSDLFGLGMVTHTAVNFGWPFMGKEVRWENGRIRKVPLPPPAHSALGLGVTNLSAEVDPSVGNYRETQLLAAYAWRMPAGVRAGATYRYLTAQSGQVGTGGHGSAVDVGLQGPIGPFEFGFSALDVVSWIRWDQDPVQPGVSRTPEENAPLTRRWNLGLAWQLSRIPLTLALQQDWEGNTLSRLQTGAAAEWHAVGPLTLRAGARRRRDAVGERMDWSAGAGFRLKTLLIDYGWLDDGRDLGPTQRWSAAIGL